MDLVGNYKTVIFPASRIATFDIGAVSKMKHQINALVEVDVTKARQLIVEKRKQQQNISFNAWLIKCISLAAEEFPEIHAVRKGNRRLVLFEDVDISMMIEKEIQGKKVPLPYVIRQTNKKSIADIYEEIKAGQQQSIHNEGNYVLGEKKNEIMMKVYYSLPGLIRRVFWKNLIHNPFSLKRNMGTIMITSVGMIGKINGWMVPASIHPLSFAIGSIMKKPVICDNEIKAREMLYMTISVDHDVIDGAPAIRALSKLIRMIESGTGL